MKRRFTLTELIIIIVIITVLASMLFPTFRRSSEIAMRTQCASNLSNIGKTFAMHYTQNDYKLPNYDWIYNESMASVYRCPKDDSPKNFNFKDDKEREISNIPTSYGFNLSASGQNLFNIKDLSSFSLSFDSKDIIEPPNETNGGYGNGNNGHGNNEDGVDSSNPGQGGPNGEVDSDPDVDDEIRDNGNAGSTNWEQYFADLEPIDADSWYYNNLNFRHLGYANHLFIDGSVQMLDKSLELEYILTPEHYSDYQNFDDSQGNTDTGNGNGN